MPETQDYYKPYGQKYDDDELDQNDSEQEEKKDLVPSTKRRLEKLKIEDSGLKTAIDQCIAGIESYYDAAGNQEEFDEITQRLNSEVLDPIEMEDYDAAEANLSYIKLDLQKAQKKVTH